MLVLVHKLQYRRKIIKHGRAMARRKNVRLATPPPRLCNYD